jgi:hypothetical protein
MMDQAGTSKTVSVLVFYIYIVQINLLTQAYTFIVFLIDMNMFGVKIICQSLDSWD